MSSSTGAGHVSPSTSAGVCLTIQGGEDATAIYSNTTQPLSPDPPPATASAASGDAGSLATDGVVTATAGHSTPGQLTESDEAAVVVECDDGYLKTLPGSTRFILVILSVISLLCLLTCGSGDITYTELPISSEIRINIFILVLTILTTTLILTLHLSSLDSIFLLDWNMIDLVLYSVLLFMYLIASSILTHALVVHHTYYVDIKEWTYEQILISIVVNYMCVLLCIYIVYHSYRVYKGYDLYNRQRLHNISTVST